MKNHENQSNKETYMKSHENLSGIGSRNTHGTVNRKGVCKSRTVWIIIQRWNGSEHTCQSLDWRSPVCPKYGPAERE